MNQLHDAVKVGLCHKLDYKLSFYECQLNLNLLNSNPGQLTVCYCREPLETISSLPTSASVLPIPPVVLAALIINIHLSSTSLHPHYRDDHKSP